jgi:allantoicase
MDVVRPVAMTDDADFTNLPDLASRALGGGVVYANDELFAEAANLLKPTPAIFSAEDFGHKGKVYDGWETRRRREPGQDYVIVRLGAGGLIRGVLIDTAWFKGNFPPEASVEGASYEGYPSAGELRQAHWETLVPRSPIKGHFPNEFEVTSPHRFTHVRLTIYPDGGVARFRVFGEVQADPRVVPRIFDLAALENGGRVVGCSDMFYNSPINLILPGKARIMGEGWENARRRGPGNDWVEFALAAPGIVRLAEIDSTHFVGNCPGEASLRGRDARSANPDEWLDLVPRKRLQPDTNHRYRVSDDREFTHIRMDVFPDGGLSRVRIFGEVSDETHDELALRWFNALTDAHAEWVGVSAGLDLAEAAKLAASRPLTQATHLPRGVTRDR